MLDTVLLFILLNVTLLTLLFWLLSFLGEFFFKKKNYNSSYEVFECGFYSGSSFNLSFNFNFCLSACLLVLYDIEFILLIPFFFNYYIITYSTLYIVSIFIVLIWLSLYFDKYIYSLEWTM